MILGLLLAMVAGSLVSLQNIFNSKVNKRVGTWTTTTIVLGMGFLASFLTGLLFEGGDLFTMPNMKLWYWFSGIIGVGVVICMTQGINLLGPTLATSIVLTSQLGFALLWDSLGWLGLKQVPFTFQQLLGVLVIVGGAMVYKLDDVRKEMEISS